MRAQPMVETINGGLADFRDARQPADTGVDRLLRCGKDLLGDFTFGFAERRKLRLDFFQHVYSWMTVIAFINASDG